MIQKESATRSKFIKEKQVLIVANHSMISFLGFFF